VQDRYQVSCRRACALARICPNTWDYKSQARDAAALRMRIRDIAQARPRFGYVRIWIMLRREGWAVTSPGRGLPPHASDGSRSQPVHSSRSGRTGAPGPFTIDT